MCDYTFLLHFVVSATQLFTEKYTSRVVMRRPKEVAVKAVHSRLFSSLNSTWRFRPGTAPDTTLIDFSVEFEVKNLLAAQAMDAFFDEVALQQVCEQRGDRRSKTTCHSAGASGVNGREGESRYIL